MANFDYQAEYGYSADELRAAILEISEAADIRKREVWHAFITYANKSLEELKEYYAHVIERKRHMDAGKALFAEQLDDDGEQLDDDGGEI